MQLSLVPFGDFGLFSRQILTKRRADGGVYWLCS
jgi:hypothetical protein